MRRHRSVPTRGTTILAVAIVVGLVTGLCALVPGKKRGAKAGRALPTDTLRPTGVPRSLTATAARLAPLHRSLPAPHAGDWRVGPGSDETGQTFAEWVASRPIRATGKRRTVYVRVIGSLDAHQRKIVSLTSEFLGLYFGLPVRKLETVAVDDTWPDRSRRTHPSWGGEQLLSTYVLHTLLAPDLPEDAAVLIGLTGWDLWPGRGWNYVFGQASLRRRVGVWSIHRFGKPGSSREAWVTCLRRTLKVATHETGHMFSLEHCLAYDCNMCGSNNLDETDRHRLALCPECMPKVCVATGVKPLPRFEALAAFCKKHGLAEEAVFYGNCVEALK